MSTAEPVMSFENVAVAYSYGGRLGWRRARKYWALRDVTFELFRGEVLGVVGRNGAGKSTLLRLIADILRPDRGRILRPRPLIVSSLTPQVGFLPQLSGRDNVFLSGLLLGLTYGEVMERLSDIIEFAGLATFIDEPIAVYSSGMRARLGFAVAYYADPECLVIDEALGFGDAEFREKSYDAMRERLRSDRTVVLTSHDEKTILSLCDRAMLIENGVSQAIGAPKDVLDELKRVRRDGQVSPTASAASPQLSQR